MTLEQELRVIFADLEKSIDIAEYLRDEESMRQNKGLLKLMK